MNLKKLAAAAVLAASSVGSAQAAPVGMELMLLVDVSGSVDTTEYNLQKSGYAAAFRSAAVQNAILNSQLGSIAVTFIEWSGRSQQSTRVGWTLIDSAASSNAFANSIDSITRAFSDLTAIQDAIGRSYLGFGTEVGGVSNGFESLRQVIDVSGDGEDNDSVSFAGTGGRDAALRAGVDTINGLPIGGGAALTNYYTNSVIGGAGAFVDPASTFAEFGASIERKLVREIQGNPVSEPSTLALLGLAFLGLARSARRRS